MKIAFISNLRGGVGRYTIELVKNLAKKIDGIDLYLVTKPKGPLNLPINVNVIVISSNMYLSFMKSIFYINKFREYDLIHTNYALFGFAAYLTKKLYKIPYLYIAHGYPQYWLENSFKLKVSYYLEKRMIQLIAKNADCFITISEYTKNLFKEKYGLNPIVIYHGVDSKKFKFDKNARTKIRKTFDLGEEDKLVLFAGHLISYKDPLTFIKSIPDVLKKFPNSKFLMKGEGPLFNKIIKLSEELNIKDSVIIQKASSDIEKYYSASDLFVLCSLNEMFGLVYLEAMACSLPVIASDSGGTPEVVGDAGILFKTGDSYDLSKKINMMFSNKLLIKKYAKKGLERIKKRFKWEDAAKKYYTTYSDMIGKGDKND